jgi:hypothetical protein
MFGLKTDYGRLPAQRLPVIAPPLQVPVDGVLYSWITAKMELCSGDRPVAMRPPGQPLRPECEPMKRLDRPCRSRRGLRF